MKKAFFKLMLVVLGLNVFTACYGPAPMQYREAEDAELPAAADEETTEEETEGEQQ